MRWLEHVARAGEIKQINLHNMLRQFEEIRRVFVRASS